MRRSWNERTEKAHSPCEGAEGVTNCVLTLEGGMASSSQGKGEQPEAAGQPLRQNNSQSDSSTPVAFERLRRFSIAHLVAEALQFIVTGLCVLPNPLYHHCADTRSSAPHPIRVQGALHLLRIRVRSHRCNWLRVDRVHLPQPAQDVLRSVRHLQLDRGYGRIRRHSPHSGGLEPQADRNQLFQRFHHQCAFLLASDRHCPQPARILRCPMRNEFKA